MPAVPAIRRVAALIALCLFAGPSAVLGAPPKIPSPLVCYPLEEQKLDKPIPVTLKTQFDRKGFSINLISIEKFCIPVEKTLEDAQPVPIKVGDHLTCWDVDFQGMTKRPKGEVPVNDQFGYHLLKLDFPTSLCEPADKEKLGEKEKAPPKKPDAAPISLMASKPKLPPSPPLPLSPMVCHQAVDQEHPSPGKLFGPAFKIKSQFDKKEPPEGHRNGVLEICTPAKKSLGEDRKPKPVAKGDHLLCYRFDPAGPVVAGKWQFTDQFGRHPTQVNESYLLCEPSDKGKVEEGAE